MKYLQGMFLNTESTQDTLFILRALGHLHMGNFLATCGWLLKPLIAVLGELKQKENVESSQSGLEQDLVTKRWGGGGKKKGNLYCKHLQIPF